MLGKTTPSLTTNIGRSAVFGVLLLTVAGCRQGVNSEATKAYQSALQAWSSGNQSAAEARLSTSVQQYPSDQRLAFFRAACLRSKFAIPEADSAFSTVIEMDPTSPLGQAASLIAKLDRKDQTPANFRELNKLVDANPDNLVMLWMLAVECRALQKNDDGIKRYKQLLSKIQEGSSLVHQTFANVLDEKGLHKEALVHREKAVYLEPASWSYDGLALTLADLGQFDKADAAHFKAAEMRPDDGALWRKWGITLLRWQKFDRMYHVLAQAVAINPRDAEAYALWGEGLEKQGRVNGARDKYLQASTIDPDNMAYIKAIARVEGKPEPQNALQAAATFGVRDLPNKSEKERRKIYVLELALLDKLSKKNPGQGIGMDNPEMVAFRNKHGLTEHEDNALSAEGEAKRWYFTPAQRKRAHLPP